MKIRHPLAVKMLGFAVACLERPWSPCCGSATAAARAEPRPQQRPCFRGRAPWLCVLARKSVRARRGPVGRTRRSRAGQQARGRRDDLAGVPPPRLQPHARLVHARLRRGGWPGRCSTLPHAAIWSSRRTGRAGRAAACSPASFSSPSGHPRPADRSRSASPIAAPGGCEAGTASPCPPAAR